MSIRKFALPPILLATFGAVSVAQNKPAHPTWPGLGRLFVGTCYHPIDRPRAQVENYIAIMKHAGFDVMRMRDLPWDSFEPRRAGLNSSGLWLSCTCS